MEDENTQPNSTNSTDIDEMWLEEALATIRVREFVMLEALGEERVERERTIRNKEKFLEIFEKTMGTVTVSCDQVGVDRGTYYHWIKTDPQFKSAIETIKENRHEMVEDRLMKLIQMDTPSSVHFYLDRKGPGYKKTLRHEIENTGGRSLEEQLYDIAKLKKAEAEAKEKKS